MDTSSDLEQGGEVENGIPKSTQWEHKFSIFGLHFYYVPSISKTFINHWEVSLCMPIAVNIIIWSSYLIFFMNYIYNLQWSLMSFTILTIFLALYVLSYFGIILEGPGYLPYYYPHRLPNSNKYPDYLSGLVTNESQFNFVKQRKSILKDAHFFKSARRIVIRPDHFCDWCSCFIGKKNFKLFFLFNFWGIFYIGFFGISSVCGFIKESAHDRPNVLLLILDMFYLFLAFFFFIFQLVFVFQVLYSIRQNSREFDNMSKNRKKAGESPFVENKENTSCLHNFEDVFGSIKYFFLWLLPIGAFHGVDDYLLISKDEEFDLFI